MDDYQIVEMPHHLIKQGILLDGTIRINEDELYWNWFMTDGVFPRRVKKYITFLD